MHEHEFNEVLREQSLRPNWDADSQISLVCRYLADCASLKKIPSRNDFQTFLEQQIIFEENESAE